MPNSYSFTLEQAATYKARTTLKPQLTPKQLKALKLHGVVSLTVMPEGSIKCTKLFFKCTVSVYNKHSDEGKWG